MVVHLVDYGYDDARDAVAGIPDPELTLPGDIPTATVVRPGWPPEPPELSRDGDAYRVRLADVRPYTVVVLR